MKKSFQIFCSFILVRTIVILNIKIFSILEKIISNLKYRALVKNSSNSLCHWSTQIKYGENLTVGSNTRIGPNCTIGAKSNITIGENVVISKGVTIETAGLDLKDTPPYRNHISKEINIGDGVWIGSNCIILSGVSIGNNSIIGAGTVVTKNIPENIIVVGSSNRILQK